MGFHKLKIRMLALAAIAVMGIIAPHARDEFRSAGTKPVVAPAIAAYGGVLVPKRVRIILGFVQTLPA